MLGYDRRFGLGAAERFFGALFRLSRAEPTLVVLGDAGIGGCERHVLLVENARLGQQIVSHLDFAFDTDELVRFLEADLDRLFLLDRSFLRF